MSDRVWQQLQEKMGNRATIDMFERMFYERDLAPVPEFLVKPIAKTLPDIIVRPDSTEELADIVALAAKENIPVTGRAGGSTVYFNSVCFRNGILADLNNLSGIQSIDHDKSVARVRAGMTWTALERELNRQGMATLAYPSSAPAATVGGWLAMMGYGLGSLRNGAFINQVQAVQAVLPDGSIRELTATSEVPVDWMANSEGTLGLVTEIEMRVRSLPEKEWHGLAGFHDAAAMQSFIEYAVNQPEKPFNLHFSDPGCNAVRGRLGLTEDETAYCYTVAYDTDGSSDVVEKGVRVFHEGLAKFSGKDLSEEAEKEWQHRFFSLILKREGPALLGAELFLPIDRLASYLGDIAAFDRSKRLGLKSYGHIVTRNYAMVMTMFSADERDTIGYLQGLALVKKLHGIGAANGASPYGIGLWNTPYRKRAFTEKQLTEMKRRKHLLDPRNIMNPGKLYQAPLAFTPPLFEIGMELLAATRLVYRGRSRE